MKIYFAGSIRGGRDNAEGYAKILVSLQQYGEVLTEHVCDPSLSSFGEKGMNDSAIYERDCAWLNQCDVVVAEVTQPSLGVGYELATAERLGKKVLCLYKLSDSSRLSAMIKGCPYMNVKEYKEINEVPAILNSFFGENQ